MLGLFTTVGREILIKREKTMINEDDIINEPTRLCSICGHEFPKEELNKDDECDFCLAERNRENTSPYLDYNDLD